VKFQKFTVQDLLREFMNALNYADFTAKI
jgi:hypothetical protein